MSLPADTPILHHYDTSPFSEKVRLTFGIKGLAWRSVIQPDVMPKPDLIALTGGYRRIPVMQIGADVFCDSAIAMAELERRFPTPGIDAGPGYAVNLWADRLWFGSSVAIIFGELPAESITPEFIADREKLSGRPFDVAAMKAAAVPNKATWRAHAAFVDRALRSSGKPFLAGDAPGVADAAAYMNIWFVRGAFKAVSDQLMAGLDALQAWRLRMNTVRHGARHDFTREEAVAVAATAEPGGFTVHDDNDPTGLKPGARVDVGADDQVRDPCVGTLVALTPERIVVERQDERAGRVHVHFPRAGFAVQAL